MVAPIDRRLADEQILIARLDRLAKWARRAGWFDVAELLSGQTAQLRKTERERSWPLGRCIWCEVDANRLREATVSDPAGGAPLCLEHFDEIYTEREADRA